MLSDPVLTQIENHIEAGIASFNAQANRNRAYMLKLF